MAAETQYTANTGMQTISTANTRLDGGGTLSSAIITGASKGTFLKTCTVKSQGSTTKGMVRLFISDGTNTRLFAEVEVDENTQAATNPSFEKTIVLNFTLKSGYTVVAATEKADTFNVIIEGQDWTYYATSVREETTKYSAYNAATTVSTANSSLTGSGTLGTILVSSGCNVWSITCKAKVTTTDGMVRIFIYDGTNTKLLTEVPVVATTQSSTVPTFYKKIVFENGFALKSGWDVKVSVEKAEAINVIAESTDWVYPA